MTRTFPQGFLFGAATAAYQIEGAAHEDGRTDSIWDAYCRVPGAVINGDDGSVACDHYHRYRDDVALMGDLGLQTYRFSTSWSRVRPDGGPVNAAGIDFYSRLVDELLEHGILPWLTLYHWDLPQALEDQGGWTNRDTAHRFAEYAESVHDALGDRIRHWTTLNEPWCAAFLGYLSGEHAPGHQNVDSALAAGHHLLLAHGLAAERLRELDPDLQLGITLNLTVPDPVDPTDAADVDAARRLDARFNRFFLDPIFRGEYPADLLAELPTLEGFVQPGDLATISTPLDALGVNYYHGDLVGAQPPARVASTAAPTDRKLLSPFPEMDGVYTHLRDLPLTDMGWEVQPEGLTRLLERVHREYTGAAAIAARTPLAAPVDGPADLPREVKLYVTENGVAYADQVASDGVVHDGERADFLRAHLGAILDAVEGGTPVHGYFYWSLLDNFEWAWGYDKRFGLVRVDYDTQERTPKHSALAYRDLIATRTL
jgi:beta-glucosidase